MNSRRGPRATEGAGGEARPDGDLAVAGVDGGDHGEQRVEAGGQVDVHVGDDLGGGAGPGGAQREPATLGGELDHTDVLELRCQLLSDLRGAVGGRVVGDGDLPGERELRGQVGVQALDAVPEDLRLVVGGDNDVGDEHGCRC
jgi:hypothetical protein